MRYTYRCKICGDGYYDVVVKGIRDWEYGIRGDFSHVRCRTCRTVQLHPFPEVKDLIDAYDIDYHGYAEASQKGPLSRLLQDLNDLLFRYQFSKFIEHDSAVLDLGCGSGEFLSRLRAMGVYQLDGVDFSERAVRLARQRGIHVYQGVFADFPAEEGSYDVVFMNHYLEHTLEPVMEVQKAHRLLRPGGALLGQLPNYRSVDRQLFGKYWGGNHAPRHTFQFEEDTLKRLLERAGFVEIKVQQELNTTHLALSIQNLMHRRRVPLRNNPELRHGRTSYYNLLMKGLIPANLLFVLLGRAGVMRFSAIASQGGRARKTGQGGRAIAEQPTSPHPS